MSNIDKAAAIVVFWGFAVIGIPVAAVFTVLYMAGIVGP
jgi:hypothetical protein